MLPGRYFVKFGGQEFEDHVIDKFHNIFPDMRESKDLKMALDYFKIRTILADFKSDGTVDKRFKKGISNLQATGSYPASLEPIVSPSKVDEKCRGQSGPAKLGMESKFTITVVKDYHNTQRELFQDLLNIDCDEDGYLTVNRSATTTTPPPKETTNTKTGINTTTTTTTTFTNGKHHATPEEFVHTIDRLSKSVIEQFVASEQPTYNPASESFEELNKKIDLCFVILVKRLLIQADKMKSTNDFMTEEGWKVWREHTWVAASFAVYFLSLQLYRYKKFGSFLDVQ